MRPDQCGFIGTGGEKNLAASRIKRGGNRLCAMAITIGLNNSGGGRVAGQIMTSAPVTNNGIEVYFRNKSVKYSHDILKTFRQMIIGNGINKFGEFTNKVGVDHAGATMALLGNNNFGFTLGFF